MKKLMRIIDARNRPNTKAWSPRINRYMMEEVLRVSMPAEQTLEDWMAQIDEVGFDRVVFTGRDAESTTGWKLPNDYIADVVHRYPNRVIGVAGIDPLKGKGALEELERSVKELGLKGVSFDPPVLPGLATDRRAYPIYAKCDELGVPIFLTVGPVPSKGVYLKQGSPLPIDEVATDFPSLNIVAAHGGWPYVHEMIAIAWRHTNVYFETSVYWFNPGADLVVEAANNTNICDKLLFATAHPFAPMKETKERFLKWPFTPEALEKVMYKNAARLFHLQD